MLTRCLILLHLAGQPKSAPCAKSICHISKTASISVMSAYNKFHGEHLGHNAYLLRTVLKEVWALDGFVISDFIWGIRDTVKAVTTGLDVEMCNTKFYGQHLIKAVERGDVSEATVDDAAQHIVRTLLRGAFSLAS